MEIFSNAVVLVKRWVQKKKDDAILLHCLAGKVPNRMVVSYDYAEKLGFELDKKYEVIITELPSNEVYGRQFRIENAGEWTHSVIQAQKEYGMREIVDVKLNAEFTTLSNNVPERIEA